MEREEFQKRIFHISNQLSAFLRRWAQGQSNFSFAAQDFNQGTYP
jgi:hypothetical protein